ncbi:uncharacterized protein UHOD_11365 [Ustilago sp. UG-2017b]|nr:uncharacterized protein UHOD_11365 [Ustilago sp. UG-2017b]
MDPEKVQTVKEWPMPESIHGIQRFLGFVNFVTGVCAEVEMEAAPSAQTEKWNWLESGGRACLGGFRGTPIPYQYAVPHGHTPTTGGTSTVGLEPQPVPSPHSSSNGTDRALAPSLPVLRRRLDTRIDVAQQPRQKWNLPRYLYASTHRISEIRPVNPTGRISLKSIETDLFTGFRVSGI